MARLSFSPNTEGTEIHRIMSHSPAMRAKWRELDASMRFDTTLDPDLKEEVRLALASGSGCEFCASVGEPRDPSATPDVRVSLACTYAEMLRNPKEIDDSLLKTLQDELSDAEIVELTCWSLFVIASQGFGAAMAVAPATDDEKQWYREMREQPPAVAAN